MCLARSTSLENHYQLIILSLVQVRKASREVKNDHMSPARSTSLDDCYRLIISSGAQVLKASRGVEKQSRTVGIGKSKL